MFDLKWIEEFVDPALDLHTLPRILQSERNGREGPVHRVVTDLAVLAFDETTRNMEVAALHPGVSAEEVRDNTGFDIEIDADCRVSAAPSAEELHELRHLDPARLYTA